MPKKKWSAADGYNKYIRDLEDVYGVDIHLSFDPKAHTTPGIQLMTLQGYWKGQEPWNSEPMAYGQYEVAMWPKQRTEATVMRGLVDFTYQCLEALIQAVPDDSLRRN